jgi:hypothetical protein
MYYNAALFNDITPVATSFDFGDFFPDPVVVIPSDPWPTSQSVTIVVAAGDTAGLMEALLEVNVSDMLVMACLSTSHSHSSAVHRDSCSNAGMPLLVTVQTVLLSVVLSSLTFRGRTSSKGILQCIRGS